MRSQAGLVILAGLPGALGGGGPWGDNDDEKSLFLWILVIFIILTIVFDYVLHTFGHWLHHLAEGEHHGHHELHATYALRPSKLMLEIWTRFQGELVALGCLAFTVWSSNQAEVFHWIAEDVFKGGSGSGSGSGSAVGRCWTRAGRASRRAPPHFV